MKKSPDLPVWQSIFWIVGSALFFSGASHKLIQFYLVKKSKKEIPIIQEVSYIVQTSFQKEALHSDYLAELLELSKDKPTLFKQFNEKEAKKKLLDSPVFQDAIIKKISPDIVYIDYSIRKPVGWALDFLNTVVDKDGYLFPMVPFFSPKKLPEIYLGQDGVQDSCLGAEPSFKHPLKGKYMDLALRVLEFFNGCEKDFFTVQRVDVSLAFFPTLGKKGVVVVLENELRDPQSKSIHFLKLSRLHFSKEIANYLKLRPHLLEVEKERVLMGDILKERVIDLRLSQLAFVD